MDRPGAQERHDIRCAPLALFYLTRLFRKVSASNRKTEGQKLMNWEITTFIAYFVILLGVALVFYFNGTNKNSEDFFLGGRSMGPWVTALSAQASDMSAWLLMGLPGSILAFGFGQMWIGIGLAIGTAANWILCAKRLRTFSKAANDSITLPQYLTNRFAVDSRALQLVCALIFLFAYTIYVASALVAGTSVFTTLFPDISPKIAMFAFLLIIVAYTFFGGFAAVCWTDFFQGLLMMAALMLVPIVVYFGHSELLDPTALETVYEYTDAATGAVTQCAFGGGIFNASWQDIVSGLGWGLGYFGMPHILLRFMAIEDKNKLKLSRRIASVWVVISMGIAILIGVIGYSLMQAGLIPTYANSSAAETIIVDIAKLISSYGYVPAFVGGIILAGILASTMSTADSQLLAAASAISQNIVQETFGVKMSQKKSMLLARLSVVVISVIAVFLARDPNSSVFRIVSFAWAGFGAVFGPVVLCALFWKRTNKWGALAGMITGGATIFIWKFVVRVKFADTIFNIYELLPAFIVGLIFIIAVSLLTPAPEKSITDTFDAVKKETKE